MVRPDVTDYMGQHRAILQKPNHGQLRKVGSMLSGKSYKSASNRETIWTAEV